MILCESNLQRYLRPRYLGSKTISQEYNVYNEYNELNLINVYNDHLSEYLYNVYNELNLIMLFMTIVG